MQDHTKKCQNNPNTQMEILVRTLSNYRMAMMRLFSKVIWAAKKEWIAIFTDFYVLVASKAAICTTNVFKFSFNGALANCPLSMISTYLVLGKISTNLHNLEVRLFASTNWISALWRGTKCILKTTSILISASKKFPQRIEYISAYPGPKTLLLPFCRLLRGGYWFSES